MDDNRIKELIQFGIKEYLNEKSVREQQETKEEKAEDNKKEEKSIWLW